MFNNRKIIIKMKNCKIKLHKTVVLLPIIYTIVV